MLADVEMGWRHEDAIIPEEKTPFSAKVSAYREQSGKKYFEVFLNNGSRARIDFLERVTTQQSFVALGRATPWTGIGTRSDFRCLRTRTSFCAPRPDSAGAAGFGHDRLANSHG
jgi:hypothetical protein